MTVMAGGSEAYRGVSLAVVAHSASVYHRFAAADGLSSQVLPRFDTIKSTDDKVKLRKEFIIEEGVVEVVADSCYFKLRG